VVELIPFGDRGKRQDLPFLLLEDMSNEVILVQPLRATVLDENDKITLFSAQNMTDGALRAVALPIIDIKNSSAFWH
jgi:hypothetical protein